MGHFPTHTPGHGHHHFQVGPDWPELLLGHRSSLPVMPVTEPYLSLEEVWTSPQM